MEKGTSTSFKSASEFKDQFNSAISQSTAPKLAPSLRRKLAGPGSRMIRYSGGGDGSNSRAMTVAPITLPPPAPSTDLPGEEISPPAPSLDALDYGRATMDSAIKTGGDADHGGAAGEEDNGDVTAALGIVCDAQKLHIQWHCLECATQCIPVRKESRCLCGHRLKEHDDSLKTHSSKQNVPCRAKGCACLHFFFVVAEGAWILRCRCKHKHVEHDCSRPPFVCKRCPRGSTSDCTGFDSPWVCNCGHAWSRHSQTVASLSRGQAGPQLQDMYDAHGKRTFSVRQDGLLAQELRADLP